MEDNEHGTFKISRTLESVSSMPSAYVLRELRSFDEREPAPR